MTDEKMLELAKRAAATTNWKPGLGNEHVREYMFKFAALVRREALEEAAKMLNYAADTAFTGSMLVWAEKYARDIRALAAQEGNK